MAYEIYSYDKELLETITTEVGDALFEAQEADGGDENEYYHWSEDEDRLFSDLKEEFSDIKDKVKILKIVEDA